MSLSEPLNSEILTSVPPKPPKASCPIWMSVGFVLIAIAICSTFVFIFTKNHYRPDDYYDPGVKFKEPEMYEVSFRIRSPTLGKDFQQPVVAHIDNINKRSRLSYYQGSNTYINFESKDSNDILITPVYDRLGCYEYPKDKVSTLPSVFPNLKHFKRNSDKEKIDGIDCDVWHYSFLNTTKGKDKDYDNYIPDEFGYSGNYTFYLNSKTGQPVALRTIGRSMFHGDSHREEYWIDYLHINKLKVLSDDLFQAPHGMPCKKEKIALYSPLSIVGDLMDRITIHEEHDNGMGDDDMEMDHSRLGKSFQQWQKAHGVYYEDHDTYLSRREIFQRNLLHIQAANAQNKGYQLSVNHLADKTAEELQALFPSQTRPSLLGSLGDDELDACTQYTVSGKDLPQSVDYRTHEKLQGYFDFKKAENQRRLTQATCNASWASALSRAIDTAHYLKYDMDEKQLRASSQSLIDCTWSHHNEGCRGGADFYAASWLIQSNEGSVAEDASYGTFLSQNGFCHYSLKDNLVHGGAKPFTTITECHHVGSQWKSVDEPVPDESELIIALKDALAFHGPVSVSINIPDDLFYYKSGIYNNPDCKKLPSDATHSLLAVGYGEEDGVEYVILENSWSQAYGEKGYIRMALNSNMCGVASLPVAVYVK